MTNAPLPTGDELEILLRQECNALCPRDKTEGKKDVYDCLDILAIFSRKIRRPAQLQPEIQSPQERRLLFLHTKRLEIHGSRQIFCPALAFAWFFSGSREQLWDRSTETRWEAKRQNLTGKHFKTQLTLIQLVVSPTRIKRQVPFNEGFFFSFLHSFAVFLACYSGIKILHFEDTDVG